MVPLGQDRLENMRSTLEAIAEELADMGRAKLVDALGTGDTAPQAQERRLSKARRAVLKAAALLREAPEDET